MEEIQIIEFPSIESEIFEQIKHIIESAFKKFEETSWNGFLKELKRYLEISRIPPGF